MKSSTLRKAGYTLLYSFLAFGAFCFWQLFGTGTFLITFGILFWVFGAIGLLIAADTKEIDEERGGKCK